jgi:hypothetical protein
MAAAQRASAAANPSGRGNKAARRARRSCGADFAAWLKPSSGRIPEAIRSQIVALALDRPELSLRELAVRFTDEAVLSLLAPTEKFCGEAIYSLSKL